MGIKDLFRRKGPATEARATATGYTSEIMAAREAWIMGGSGVADLTATVQSCVSLWEGAFALADVQGTTLIDRRSMAIMARALALRGEAVFLIRDRLIPATDWDMKTRHGIPTAYRVSLSEIGGAERVTALAGEVLHIRIGADHVTPWAGSSPLRRSSLSADLLERVETALRDVYRDAPIGGAVMPFPETPEADLNDLSRRMVGYRGRVMIRESVNVAAAGGPAPSLDWRPQNLTPDLNGVLPAETLRAARGAILSAYGVLPALFNDQAQGPLVREAQRHLAQWTLQPVAMLLAEEATAKLATPVMVDVMRPVQAFDVGGRARALSTIIEAMARAKEAGLTEGELNAALTHVNWGDGDGAA